MENKVLLFLTGLLACIFIYDYVRQRYNERIEDAILKTDIDIDVRRVYQDLESIIQIHLKRVNYIITLQHRRSINDTDAEDLIIEIGDEIYNSISPQLLYKFHCAITDAEIIEHITHVVTRYIGETAATINTQKN